MPATARTHAVHVTHASGARKRTGYAYHTATPSGLSRYDTFVRQHRLGGWDYSVPTTPTATPWSRSGHVDKHMKVLVLRGAPARTARSFALTTTAQHARLRIPFSMCVLPDMLTRALHRWRAEAQSVSHGCAADASASDTVRARPADLLLLRQLRSRSTALE